MVALQAVLYKAQSEASSYFDAVVIGASGSGLYQLY
jgi:hypothetical protein